MNYSEEEKEAIERIQKRIKDNEDYSTNQVWLTEDVRCSRVVLNLIQKQSKIIEKMAEQFYNLYKNIEVVRDSFDMPFGKFLKSKEEVIEFFKKEVEKECNIKNG